MVSAKPSQSGWRIFFLWHASCALPPSYARWGCLVWIRAGQSMQSQWPSACLSRRSPSIAVGAPTRTHAGVTHDAISAGHGHGHVWTLHDIGMQSWLTCSRRRNFHRQAVAQSRHSSSCGAAAQNLGSLTRGLHAAPLSAHPAARRHALAALQWRGWVSRAGLVVKSPVSDVHGASPVSPRPNRHPKHILCMISIVW